MQIVSLILLAATIVTLLACADGEPTAAPTTNVDATVEARVRGTLESESAINATVEARVAKTTTTSPTATPIPTLRPTPSPTPTPYPTPGGNPSQDEVADMAGRLFDCIQVNEEFKVIYEQSAAYGATTEGMTRDASEDLVTLMLSSREFFILAFQELINEDPSMGLSLSTEMNWCLDTLHGQVTETVEPNHLFSDVYDCLQEDSEMRDIFQEGAVLGVIAEGLTREAAEDLVALLLSNREFFVLSFMEAQRQDPSILSDIESMVADCP